jgi:beta-glucosidase/6-phospho-beta-glucosidase/beta-galactosidase
MRLAGTIVVRKTNFKKNINLFYKLMSKNIFQSYLMGGFECSTHVNWQRRRIDVIEATRHDEFAEADYTRMLEIGMKTARDGARWHLIEREPYKYDFSSVSNQVRAAKKTGMQVIWDLFHYGYPEDLDIFSEEFPMRFSKFAEAFTVFLMSENYQTPVFCPVNEISFFSWIAGRVGAFYPFRKKRGAELKKQLVRATILGIDIIRSVAPEARFIQIDPAIHVSAPKHLPQSKGEAKRYHLSQYEAFDMVSGRRNPELGGNEKYLDIIGINYYSDNQWRHPSGERVFREHEDYHPLNFILQDFFERYKRPILIAETGIENEARPEWFRYICEEAKIASANGVQLEGICLYPIVNHPGWDDDRHCHNGLWDYPDKAGKREIYAPLAEEIKSQQGKTELRRMSAHN